MGKRPTKTTTATVKTTSLSKALVTMKPPLSARVIGEETQEIEPSVQPLTELDKQILALPPEQAIRAAVGNGSLRAAKELLKRNPFLVDVHIYDSQDGSRTTLGHVAIGRGEDSMLDLLLRNGLPVNATSSRKISLMQLAVLNMSVPMVKLLLEHGGNPNLQPVWLHLLQQLPELLDPRPIFQIAELLYLAGGKPQSRETHCTCGAGNPLRMIEKKQGARFDEFRRLDAEFRGGQKGRKWTQA